MMLILRLVHVLNARRVAESKIPLAEKLDAMRNVLAEVV